MGSIEDENENEKSTWRRSINTMVAHGDLEGLKDMKDSEVLDDDFKEYLEKTIKILEEKQLTK